MHQWILPAVMSLSLGAGAHQTFEPISPPQDTERHPNELLLERETMLHGPDGHFAVEGVLQRRYCFSEPTAVCVPAGSTVRYSGQMPGYNPRTGATVPPEPPVLDAVDATAPITAYGLTFAAHKPTPKSPEDDSSTRIHSLIPGDNDVGGLLAKELSFAGVVIGRGEVLISLDDNGKIAGVDFGKLGAEVTAGRFTIPKGSTVSVCPDGIHYARAPRATKRGGKPIVAGNELLDEIVATREGDGPAALTGMPEVCTRKLIGWKAGADSWPREPYLHGSKRGNSNSFNVQGNAEAGSTVRLYTTAGCLGPVVASGTATGGNFSIGVTVADNSTNVFWATATNSSGQTSGCARDGFVYVEDSTAPTAPTRLSVSASPFGTDFRTVSSLGRTLTPTVSGSAEADATVKLYGTSACNGSVLAKGETGSSPGFFIQTTVSANTRHTFYATATDRVGNESACSTSFVVYVSDTLAPNAPILVAIGGTSGAPTVSGTAEANSLVKVYSNSTCTGSVLESASADVSGNFTVTVSNPNNSVLAFYATATDAAGNVSGCSTTSVRVEQ